MNFIVIIYIFFEIMSSSMGINLQALYISQIEMYIVHTFTRVYFLIDILNDASPEINFWPQKPPTSILEIFW